MIYWIPRERPTGGLAPPPIRCDPRHGTIPTVFGNSIRPPGRDSALLVDVQDSDHLYRLRGVGHAGPGPHDIAEEALEVREGALHLPPPAVSHLLLPLVPAHLDDAPDLSAPGHATVGPPLVMAAGGVPSQLARLYVYRHLDAHGRVLRPCGLRVVGRIGQQLPHAVTRPEDLLHEQVQAGRVPAVLIGYRIRQYAVCIHVHRRVDLDPAGYRLHVPAMCQPSSVLAQGDARGVHSHRYRILGNGDIAATALCSCVRSFHSSLVDVYNYSTLSILVAYKYV